ncbi:hypothetical protein [Urbifossiella limnaea]|uniref:Uncharacterized protein n=1 Tax=Urbifossiella limnaea TaxID=2528023 RepID=A0A517XUU2_9BACT|nr:hypothetical protein [Urbifossiella limnaea]QDU21275.1 hypothetical protein ETAA1_32410 [Urbifossiella limnaea]
MSARRGRLDRLRSAVKSVAAAAAVAPTEVWLPVKDCGTEVPGRYPMPGGRAVLVLYAPDDPEPA